MGSVPSNGELRGLAAGGLGVHNPPVIGVSLVPLKPRYPEGSLPDFEVRIQNNGRSGGRLCTYMLKYRLLFALTAKNDDFELGFYPFQKGKWDTFKATDLVSLVPGKTHVERLELSKLQGWAFFRRNDQPPLLTWNHRTPGFQVGKVTFITSFFPAMALYTGLDGAHDFQVEPRRLPEQIPGLAAGDHRDVFRDEVTARTTVEFTKKA